MILFYVDGNKKVGFGHVMRCLSIADAGREYLHQSSLFILASPEPEETIKNRGHKCVVLNVDYRNIRQEIFKLQKMIYIYLPSVVCVDSYYVDFEFLDMLHNTAKRIGGRFVYIDDVMLYAYSCDILINYNIYGPNSKTRYEELYRRTGYPLPRLLLGTHYVPLRMEFQNLEPRVVKKRVEKILISTGGADPEHIAWKIARYLVGRQETDTPKRFDNFQFHFLIGAMNEDYKKIKTITSSTKNIFLHFNIANIQQLMRKSDIALAAAGSTLYELCVTQTPTVTYILADNQIPAARAFEEHHLLYCAGDVRNMTEQDIAEKLLGEALSLASDYKKRKEISIKQRTLVDGNGARRIVEELFEISDQSRF